MVIRVRQGPKGLCFFPRTRLKAGVKYDEEEQAFVGYAPALNIYSQANSEDRAKRVLERTITLFLGAARNSRVLTGIPAMRGSNHGHFRVNESPEDEYIRAVEEAFLEQKKFDCIFDIAACLPLEGLPTS